MIDYSGQQSNNANPNNPMRTNQFGQFKQLIVGAGSNIFKAQGPWIWAGATTPGNATFSIYLPTGALTTTGTINATGGIISGDLTVTGSFLTDDGAAFQTKINAGKISFLKSGAEKAYIKTAGASNGIQISTDQSIFFTDAAGIPKIEMDSSGNLKINNGGAYIRWSSGRKITDNSSKLTADGDFETTGSFISNGDGGKTGTFKDQAGNTITVTGGIITGGI